MRHMLPLPGRCLAAVLFTAIGLGAYGCGDSATVNPVVELSGLSVTTGTTTAALQPRFSPATTDYTVQLSSGVTTVTVTARPAVDGDSVSINGQATTNRAISLEPAGQTTVVNIVVSESNTNSRTYTVKLVRAGFGGINSLETLSVSPGKLAPAFTADEQFYRVDDIKSTDTKVTVTATPEDPIATMTVDGLDTASGQGREITLKPAGQITTIEIFVKAQNGQVKQYHVEVPRGTSGNNDLVNLTLSPVRLQGFNRNTSDYTVNVGNNVPRVTITPTLDDPTTASMSISANNGQPDGQPTTINSGNARTITLRAAGQSTVITIRVTAQNGSQKPYTVTLDRAAPPPPSGNNNLSALTVRQSTSSPNLINFSPNTTSYTVDVGSGVSTIRVTPTSQDPAATLTVTSNGQVTTSGQTRIITLRAAGLTTSINIVVRAVNGSEKPYTITVDRAAPPPPSGNNNLQSLTTSPGTLTPLFDVNRIRTDYAVNDISSSATSITVTATPQDSGATVTINDVGGNSRSIPLPTGPSNTEINVRVIAPNNNGKTYSITVNQPAPATPPAPSSAPDLLREDDTCPSGIPPDECAPDFNGNPTSKEDNITTVTTPRFSIPPPGAGETAKLYIKDIINGNEFPSSLDSNNTFRPNNPLPEGDFDITYTLSNSGGESGPSPALRVTIDTGGITPPPPPPTQ